VELLPFRKLCIEKYKAMGIDFALSDVPEANEEMIEELRRAAT
jgi:pyruvate formate lyase activating enzyme